MNIFYFIFLAKVRL